MDTKHLNRLEQKYVFNISLGFWRFLVGLAGVGLVGGVLLLLWGMVPSIKSSVKKEKYPPVVTVSLQELQAKVLPVTELKTIAAQQSPQKEPTVEASTVIEEKPAPALGEEAYNSLLDSLKALIPPTKYAWKTRGHWEYPYGKRYWDRYRDSRYRKWKVDRYGINDRLKAAYERANAGDYVSKRELLNAYVAVVNRFPEERRSVALESLTAYSKESVPQSIANVELLNAAISNFSSDRVDCLKKLAVFGQKNPNDGRSFIEYASANLNKFDPDVQLDALQALISRYYSHFNNRIGQQKEITDLFLPQLDSFEAEYQVKALENYYELYLQKNADRMAAIQQIDYEYKRGLSRAASEHQMNKSSKGEWRMRGLYAIGGAIVFIAFIALILALLSIQRYLERIHENLQATGSVSSNA